MANVTVLDKMRDDPAFDTVGVLLGMEGDLVRFRMVRLWSWQTDNFTANLPTYAVDALVIVGALKSREAPAALVEAGLATLQPDGRYYIHGTEGQIEWLWKKRAAGARGGEVRAKAAADAGRAWCGRFKNSAPPSTDQAPTKQPPSTDQAQHQASTTPHDPGSVIREDHDLEIGTHQAPTKHPPSTSKRKRTPVPMPADFAPTDAHRATAAEHGLDLDAEVERFRLHHEAKGNAFASWNAALSMWLNNAVRFSRGRTATLGAPAQNFRLVRPGDDIR